MKVLISKLSSLFLISGAALLKIKRKLELRKQAKQKTYNDVVHGKVANWIKALSQNYYESLLHLPFYG